MKFYKVEPNVAGSFGDNSVIDFSVYPAHCEHFHHVFEWVPLDDLMEVYPCYVVTQRLRNALDGMAVTGCHFADLEVSIGDQFEYLYKDELAAGKTPEDLLPVIFWLQVFGVPAVDDFGRGNLGLIISERVLQALLIFGLRITSVVEYFPDE